MSAAVTKASDNYNYPPTTIRITPLPCQRIPRTAPWMPLWLVLRPFPRYGHPLPPAGHPAHPRVTVTIMEIPVEFRSKPPVVISTYMIFTLVVQRGPKPRQVLTVGNPGGCPYPPAPPSTYKISSFKVVPFLTDFRSLMRWAAMPT